MLSRFAQMINMVNTQPNGSSSPESENRSSNFFSWQPKNRPEPTINSSTHPEPGAENSFPSNKTNPTGTDTTHTVSRRLSQMISTSLHIPPFRRPNTPTEEEAKTSEATHQSQQILPNEPAEELLEPPLNQKLRQSKETLENRLRSDSKFLHNNHRLINYYRYLIAAAKSAEKVTVALISPKEALEESLRYHLVPCYTWHTIENSSPDTPESELFYIAIDGTTTKLLTTSTDRLTDFLTEKNIAPKTNNGIQGVSVPAAIFQQFLTENKAQTLDANNASLNNLIQLLDGADLELRFHGARGLLQDKINSAHRMEFPGCDLYLMPIPDDKKSTPLDCYIWDGKQLVYIPSVIKNEEQNTFEENINRQPEYVSINNRRVLSQGIRELVAKNSSKTQLSLSSSDHHRLIYSNGGHSYDAKAQYKQIIKTAEEALEHISFDWSANLIGWNILYSKPLESQMQANTLYIYKDDHSRLKYTHKRSEQLDTPSSQPEKSFITTLFSYFNFNKTEPTPPVFLSDKIEGDLNLDAHPTLLHHINYAITRQWLGYEQEHALWMAVSAQTPSLKLTSYKPKDTEYFTKINKLTSGLFDALTPLNRYIRQEQESTATSLENAQNELRSLINNDDVYDTLKHDTISRRTVAAYEEAARFYKIIPDDPRHPKLKSLHLALAINERIHERIKTVHDASHELSIHELPPILLQILNKPVAVQATQYTKRQLNIPLMLIGAALVAASIALFVLSHGFSAPLSYAGIVLGTQLMFNMTLAAVPIGTGIYATGLFFGPRKVFTEVADESLSPHPPCRAPSP